MTEPNFFRKFSLRKFPSIKLKIAQGPSKGGFLPTPLSQTLSCGGKGAKMGMSMENLSCKSEFHPFRMQKRNVTMRAESKIIKMRSFVQFFNLVLNCVPFMFKMVLFSKSFTSIYRST